MKNLISHDKSGTGACLLCPRYSERFLGKPGKVRVHILKVNRVLKEMLKITKVIKARESCRSLT